MARCRKLASRSACAAGATALLVLTTGVGGAGAAARATGAAAAQTSPLSFRGCRPAQEPLRTPGLQCATLQVPLNRAEPDGPQLGLAVQRIPASGPHTGTLVLLAGGPGQPAIPFFEQLLAPLAHSAQMRGLELVTFDQRGTGQSGFLKCDERRIPASDRTVTAFFGACGEQLGRSRPDYTSQESVEDLESLRLALGGTPLSLLAVSYGGRVAGMYAHEYPQGVARMVLDSPSPLVGDNALGIPSRHALPRVLDDALCGRGACSSFTSDDYEDLTRLMARLARGPIRARIFNGRGRRRETTITEARVYTLLSGTDLYPSLRDLVPAAIASAAGGRPAALARLTANLAAEAPAEPAGEANPLPAGRSTAVPISAQAAPEDSALSLTLFAATVCAETELPWTAGSQPATRPAALDGWLAALTPGLTAPFSAKLIAREAPISICLDWPSTTPAPSPPSGVSAVPTLILGGEDDLRTPLEQDQQIALGYSDVRLLEIPATGHSTFTTDLSGCAHRAAIAFLASGGFPGPCPAPSVPQAVPLPPASLGAVSPAHSASALAGRVGAAAALTLEDVFGQPPPSGGGLLGGSWERRGSMKLALHGFEDVDGVRVSGTVTVMGADDLAGTLRIRGRLAGTLRLRGHALGGRLGGARVQAWLQHI